MPFRALKMTVVLVVFFPAIVAVRAQVALAQSPDADTEPKAEQILSALEGHLQECIRVAEKSVVAIARVRSTTLNAVPGAELFERPGDRLPMRGFRWQPDTAEPNTGGTADYGAGVVISSDGMIVTNYHVLGDPHRSQYFVRQGGRTISATVQAADPWTDLAVLKVESATLAPITLGDASRIRKGQIVIALGNPHAVAADGHPSATWGMISNLARKAPKTTGREPTRFQESLHYYGTLIQTDTKLPFGMSGGALLDLQGRMIGLTSSLAPFEGAEVCAGFAIPVDETFRKSVELLKDRRQPEFGFLGVAPSAAIADGRGQTGTGVRIHQVVPGTPAYRAGLKGDDLILAIADQPVREPNDLIREVSRHFSDEVVEIRLRRSLDGELAPPLTLKARLSKKYIGGSRLPYSQQPNPSWRGTTLEYSTAIPDFQQWVGQLDPEGCVAIVHVEMNSPAWTAGLRSLSFVTHVDDHRVTTPREFFDIVSTNAGPVRVQLFNNEKNRPPVVVEP